jgi:hypothetical protein
VTVPPFLLFFFSLDGSNMESQLLESAGGFFFSSRARVIFVHLFLPAHGRPQE